MARHTAVPAITEAKKLGLLRVKEKPRRGFEFARPVADAGMSGRRGRSWKRLSDGTAGGR